MGNPTSGGTATAAPADAASPLGIGANGGPLAGSHPASYSPQLRNLSCSLESSWIGSPPSWPSTTVSSRATAQSISPPETEARCPLLDWGCVSGLTVGQIKQLRELALKGVLWAAPGDGKQHAILELHCLGSVEADGNCMFTAIARCLQAHGIQGLSPWDVRRIAVKRFVSDCRSGVLEKEQTDLTIRHLYCPNLESGWGVHVLQEVKLLAKRSDRMAMDAAIEELVATGMTREAAAGSIFKERCVKIEDSQSWGAYMSCMGGPQDEFDIVTLVYTEEGLLSVGENRDGKGAAFGDDIALESLATEWKRQIFVLQTHPGTLPEDDGQLFFLPHTPRHAAGTKPVVHHPPLFLLMKGTDWCAGGSDHYDPIYAKARRDPSGKPAFAL